MTQLQVIFHALPTPKRRSGHNFAYLLMVWYLLTVFWHSSIRLFAYIVLQSTRSPATSTNTAQPKYAVTCPFRKSNWTNPPTSRSTAQFAWTAGLRCSIVYTIECSNLIVQCGWLWGAQVSLCRVKLPQNLPLWRRRNSKQWNKNLLRPKSSNSRSPALLVCGMGIAFMCTSGSPLELQSEPKLDACSHNLHLYSVIHP